MPSIDLGPTLPVTTGWTPMGPDRRPTITVEDSQERASTIEANITRSPFRDVRSAPTEQYAAIT